MDSPGTERIHRGGEGWGEHKRAYTSGGRGRGAMRKGNQERIWRHDLEGEGWGATDHVGMSNLVVLQKDIAK